MYEMTCMASLKDTWSAKRSSELLSRTTTLSASSRNASRPCRAISVRPSASNGRIAIPTVTAPFARAARATTGAAPVPAEPPRPATMNTISDEREVRREPSWYSADARAAAIRSSSSRCARSIFTSHSAFDRPAGSADADDRDFRVHGVLEQAADDLVHKGLWYQRFRPPISSVDLSREAGRPFARGEECIPSLLLGSHSFFPSLPWRFLPSGVRHAHVLHGGMTPSLSPVETATTLPVTLSTSCLWSWISFTRSRVNQSSTLRTTACSRLRK